MHSDNVPMNPVILITGAARRIGAVIAEVFHKQGYTIVIHYNRSAAAANKLCDQLNEQRADSCLLVQSDLNDCLLYTSPSPRDRG